MNTIDINSSNIYAFIVGIEKYDFQDFTDFPGPSSEAIRFAKWLRNQKVPANNIWLFVSFLEKQESSVDIDVEIREPTRNNIASILDTQLFSSSQCGDLLYIFWGGHGCLTRFSGKTTRRLLCQDSLVKDSNSNYENFYNLNVEKLITALKESPKNLGFKKQVFLIDSCATLVTDNDSVASFESDEIPCRYNPGLSLKVPIHNQEIFYGAVNFGVSKGKLSNAFLDFLEQQPSLFLNSEGFKAYLDNLQPPLEFIYGQSKSDTYGFNKNVDKINQFMNKPKTILADRDKILQFFREMILSKQRERILSIRVPQGTERDLLIKRLKEEARYNHYLAGEIIEINLNLANPGVSYISYIFSQVIQQLGIENFPEFSSKVKNLLNNDELSEDDSEILSENCLQSILQKFGQDYANRERKNRLSQLTQTFFEDLFNFNQEKVDLCQKKILIIIDGYCDKYSKIQLFESVMWLEEQFISKINETKTMIWVLFGKSSTEEQQQCKVFQLDILESRIPLQLWLEYCQAKKYQVNENQIRELAEKSLITDQMYLIVDNLLKLK